jgi:hypothetical protein
VLDTDTNTRQAILATDATFTPFSTVAVEATYMNKPAISIQPELQSKDNLWFVTQQDIVTGRYTNQDCIAIVKKVLEEPEYRNSIVEKAKQFERNDNATENVTKLVYSLL